MRMAMVGLGTLLLCTSTMPVFANEPHAEPPTYTAGEQALVQRIGDAKSLGKDAAIIDACRAYIAQYPAAPWRDLARAELAVGLANLGDWQAVGTTVQDAVNQTPRSAALPAALAKCIHAALLQGKRNDADVLRKTLENGWPSSAAAWDACIWYYQDQARRDPEEAWRVLARDAARTTVDSTYARLGVRRTRWLHLAKYSPRDWEPEAQKALDAVALADRDDLVEAITGCYDVLIALGQVEAARRIHVRVRQALTPSEGVPGAREREMQVFLDALTRNRPTDGEMERLSACREWARAARMVRVTDPEPRWSAALYSLLIRRNRCADALSLHSEMAGALVRMGADATAVRSEDEAFARALRDAAKACLSSDGPAEDVQLRGACHAVWQAKPQDNAAAVSMLAAGAQDPAWLAAFCDWSDALQAGDPAWATGQLAVAAFARRAAGRCGNNGQLAQICMAASEARYTRVVQAAGANAEARRSAAQGLALVFTDQNRTDVGALVTTATGDVLVELLAWRAERDFVKGDPVALGSALSDYRRLGDLAQNDARAASWMYRLACCLKRTGKLTEATAAFRLLIDRFPASPCAAPATWQLDDMGKEAK